MKLSSPRSAVLLLLLAVLEFSSAAPSLGQEKKSPTPDADLPLHITAARLEADQEKRLITFSGEVKAQKGDATLYADQLLVYYEPGPGPEAAAKGGGPARKPEAQSQKPGKGDAGQSPLTQLGGEKIDRIVAKGRVRFVQENKLATGEEATYYQQGDEIVLVGHPQVWQGENTIKGERIVFNLKDNRATVESSPKQRVEASLYQAQGAAPPGQGSILQNLPGQERRRPRPRRP